jgi:hypothetical protein
MNIGDGKSEMKRFVEAYKDLTGFGEPALIVEDRVRFIRQGMALVSDPELHRTLDLDPAELGAFRAARPGRGGSGVTTPAALALLTISYAVDVKRRSMLAEKTLELAAAEYKKDPELPSTGEPCPFTGARNLINALARMLADETLFARTVSLQATEGHCAVIADKLDSGETEFADFCRPGDLPPMPRYHTVGLDVPLLSFLRDLLNPTELEVA